MQVPPLYQTPPHGGGDDGQARGRVLHRRSDGYGDDGEVCSVWASEPLGRHRLGVAVLGTGYLARGNGYWFFDTPLQRRTASLHVPTVLCIMHLADFFWLNRGLLRGLLS